MSDVILHAFDWHYGDIEKNAPKIAQCGYGAVLIPPPLYSDENCKEWWQRYQPKDYRVLRSALGNKNDLKKAINALHEAGVRIYADIVFNHMANEKGSRPDPFNFPGEQTLKRYTSKKEKASFEADRIYGKLDEGLFSPQDFNPDGDIRNWNNPDEVMEGRLGGLPDLDLNDWIVLQQRTCLKSLNDLGFDGYRVDAMKHMPIRHLERVFNTEDMRGKFIFGETLTSNDHEEALFLNPLLKVTSFPCYDFPLQETLRRVFSPPGSLRELVNPAAFGQALPWYRAVTVAITHDIPNNDGFRGLALEAQDEYLAHAYLLGRDGGVPLIYSDNNQSAQKYPEDLDRWANAWMRNDITSMIRFHNAVHGTPQRSLFEADGFFVFCRGDRGIVAINKTDDWQHPTIWTWGLCHGTYSCQLHGYQMEVSGDTFSFAIPPRQAQMWLCTD